MKQQHKITFQFNVLQGISLWDREYLIIDQSHYVSCRDGR